MSKTITWKKDQDIKNIDPSKLKYLPKLQIQEVIKLLKDFVTKTLKNVRNLSYHDIVKSIESSIWAIALAETLEAILENQDLIIVNDGSILKSLSNYNLTLQELKKNNFDEIMLKFLAKLFDIARSSIKDYYINLDAYERSL